MLPRTPFKLRAFRPFWVLLPFIALAATAPVFAADDDDFVVREYSFPLTDIEEVELHGSVGSMRIVPIEGNEIRLVLEIEGNDEGWMRGDRDVSDVELDSTVRGKRLVLRQTEEDTNTEWTVELPAVARTTINFGVGDIDAELGATELDVDMGVGDVEISLPEASTGEVDIAVGVGDAHLRGAEDVDHESSFVSQDIEGHGAGTLDAKIDVGVGDVTVELE